MVAADEIKFITAYENLQTFSEGTEARVQLVRRPRKFYKSHENIRETVDIIQVSLFPRFFFRSSLIETLRCFLLSAQPVSQHC